MDIYMKNLNEWVDKAWQDLTDKINYTSHYIGVGTPNFTEDGKYIAVRFHDFTGGTNKLTVTPGFAWKRYCECDLRERPQGDFKENGTIQRTVKPYEIVTLLFEV